MLVDIEGIALDADLELVRRNMPRMEFLHIVVGSGVIALRVGFAQRKCRRGMREGVFGVNVLVMKVVLRGSSFRIASRYFVSYALVSYITRGFS